MARWRLILVLALAACCGLAAMALESDRPGALRGADVQPATGVTPGHTPGSPLDEIIYYEDWQTGDMAGWTAVDYTNAPSVWHLDDFNAFGGSGTSWWMGDTTINGYLDDWYMVLDSPPIQLGATPSVLFWHRWSCEDPAGAETVPDYPPNTFNGWDGMNIRISTNGGTTWTVIPGAAVSPTYTRSSLYSFGHQHEEGPGIPGWCGPTVGTNWHQITANLSAWANQNVKIRWAFASDPAAHPGFGWMVDNIRVYNGANDTVFTTNANAIDGFTHTSLTGDPVGQLWHVATDPSSPHGSFVLACNSQSTGHILPGTNNAIISPLIPLGDIGFGTLTANFALTGDLTDANNGDRFSFEVSADSGRSWCSISNPDCDTADVSYVFLLTNPGFWFNFAGDSGFSEWEEIPFRDQAIQFRIGVEADGDNELGTGLFIDGFTLEFTSGLPNDVTLYTLQVRYPTMVNYLTPVRAYFRNAGQNAATFPAFYRVNTGPWIRFGGGIQLNPGAVTTRDTLVTFVAPAVATVQARSALSGDQNLNNDTSTVANIVVQPAGAFPEIGYDNRNVIWRFNYATGEGPVAHFTPLSDGVTGPSYDVREIKAQFDSEQSDNRQFRLHVYLGGQPGQGTEVVNQMVTVTPAETGINTWKVIDLTGVPALQDISQDYWVWFEVTESGAMRFPMILGDDEEPWADEHFHVYDGSTLSNVTYFYQMHSVINASPVSVDEIPGELPAVWALEQNYPNPFNPATEIRFSVPKAERMTLKVYNLMGQEVATLVNEILQPGMYNATFDASDLPSGVYVYRLDSETYTASHKMLLLK